jgi:DNA polymerase I-like protein with 3'-5' exonuclease and polymerase domains
MELFGMPIDWSLAEDLRKTKEQEYQKVLEVTEQIVRKSQQNRQTTLLGSDAGVDLNFNSPIQVLRYLQDKLGFQDVTSSDVETLKSLDHPVAAKFLELRTLEKHLNFLDQLESFGGHTGRLYPNYNQCRAATGRMSSYRYNQQQVPKRGSGAVFRTLFRAQPGWRIVKADFSAIEMRVMAAVCRDIQMVEAIKTGVDLHKLTASKVLNKPIEDVTKEDRQQAKAVNFGFLYGMTSSTFKKYAWLNYSVRLSEDQADQARKAFFELYPDLQNWHMQQRQRLYHPEPFFMHTFERGIYSVPAVVQRTVLGRARYWANFQGQTLAKPNEFYNSAIQGTSADITKQTLIELYATLPDSAHLVGVVHDEILVEAPDSIADEVKELMLRTMRSVGSAMLEVVPVDAEAVVSDSWGM